MAENKKLVEASQLRCYFPRGRDQLAAVDGVDLDIARGQVLGLVGESGSGKSTLGRIIAGLQSRSGGGLKVNGVERAQKPSTRDFRRFAGQVQVVFQDSYSCLNPRRKILDSVMEPLLMQGRSRSEAKRRAEDWLGRVNMNPALGQRYPHELSGGQRQRLGIARAFAVEPALVICDEAVSALDVSVQAQVLALLKELQCEQGTAMLFISHDLAVVRHLADSVAVMYQGNIVEQGPVSVVYTAPRHPYTRTLLAQHLEASAPSAAQSEVQSAATPLKTSLPLSSDRGCRYSLRCDYAQQDCSQRRPALELGDRGSAVACWHQRENMDC